MKRNLLISACVGLACSALPASAQISRLTHDVDYAVEMSGTASSGDYAPFWLTSNRYGLSSVENNSGYIRGRVQRSTQADSTRLWRVGYGLDLAIPANYTSKAVVQQFYFDVDLRAFRLSVGAKERGESLKNAALSSGGLTQSVNARPVPQVRVELPDFWAIPGTHNWLAVKGHLAYGLFTDNRWQRETHPEGALYSANALYHSKAGFLRIGNEKKFPLSFIGGLEMSAQFGGEAWNLGRRTDDPTFDNSHVNMGHGFKSFWHAFIPGGSDAFDGAYLNNEGNQLGSWHFQLNWKGKDWNLKAYAEHFFEDHSQMFLEYGWKDMLWGVEATLPKNPFVSTVLYEHLRTTDQTGGLYHDATPELGIQISGLDNYYNHSFYGAWQHWGQAMGNPLLLSPVYNENGEIKFKHNRITAHHFGLSGQPLPELSYRLLFSHVRSLGSYEVPNIKPQFANYFMAQADYAPRHFHGLSFSAAVGSNGGSLIGNSFGGMLTLRKTGHF